MTDDIPEDQRMRRASPTGRSARFYAPLESEDDVEAIAQRVAQHCAVALQRSEADSIQIIVQEAANR